jgi:hypothetical protein
MVRVLTTQGVQAMRVVRHPPHNQLQVQAIGSRTIGRMQLGAKGGRQCCCNRRCTAVRLIGTPKLQHCCVGMAGTGKHTSCCTTAIPNTPLTHTPSKHARART